MWLLLALGLWLNPPVRGEITARLEPVVSGLNHPIDVVRAPDGSNRLFVVEWQGRIRIVENGALLNTPFLDIENRVEQRGEGGLLGLALHPAYRSNGRFFVNYTASDDSGLKTILSEYRVSLADPNRAATAETILLEIHRSTDIHHAGDIDFGPDGYLYLSSGDGGPQGDPENKAQDLRSLRGKILRIDVDGEQPYAIPPDNPFVSQPEIRPEIWAYGFRNPFRMAFDRLTGRLFAGDVGMDRREEVNLVVKGGNYGWNRTEGTLCFPSWENCDRQGLIDPAFEYGREQGGAVIGGVIYRGGQPSPAWGRYLFGDFVSKKILNLEEVSRGRWEARELLDLNRGNVFRIRFEWEDVLAHFADGISPQGVFRSVLVVVNPFSETVSGSLESFRSNGQPATGLLEGAEDGLLPFEIAPRSSRLFVTLGRTSGLTKSLLSGWARVRSERPLTVSLLYSLNTPGGQVRLAGVTAPPVSRSFSALVGRDRASARDTALALANPSPSEEADVTLILLDTAQVEVGSHRLRLAGQEQSAFFISDLADLQDSFQGTLHIESSRPLAAALLTTRQGIHEAGLPLSIP